MNNAPSSAARAVLKKKRGGALEICLLLAVSALLVQLFPNFLRIWREWPTPGYQTPGCAALKTENGIPYEMRYLLYLPQNYSSETKWPLLLYLHGSGERGYDLDRVKLCGPNPLLARGLNLPMMILVPQCRPEQSWNIEQLSAFLDQMESKFSIDRDRVYVAGFSMGGNGAWQLASGASERFAGIVPVAGDGSVGNASALVNLPIWAFHGEEDKTVPAQGSTKIVEAIKQAGGQPKLTIFPKTGHHIDSQVFSRTDVYDWLLKQKRRAAD
jgi:predicted peptidase